MNEAQVAQAADGAVYFNSRTRGNITGKPGEVRASALSTDGKCSSSLRVFLGLKEAAKQAASTLPCRCSGTQR